MIEVKPIQFVMGLGLWGYAVIYHMDLLGMILSGIGMLFYGYSIAEGKVMKLKKNKLNSSSKHKKEKKQ